MKFKASDFEKSLEKTYHEHVTEDDRQRTNIEVIFNVHHSPATPQHLFQLLKAYLKPKGIELREDLTIEV